MAQFHRILLISFILTACSSSSNDGTTSKPDASVDASSDASIAADAASDDASAADSSAVDAGTLDASGIVADRPYTLHVPTSYDKSKPAPLVVMFHGYGASGSEEEIYFHLTTTSDANGFLYAYGDGTVDSTGSRFWNATDACCNKDHSTVDDVAYFDAIVQDVSTKYNVDPKRVYVIGHSNGGFMAHRLACDRAGTVAAIVSLAGAVYEDATQCNPSKPVPVLEVHGDADMTILYAGGMTAYGTYPSANQTVATWAQKNGCTGALAATGATLDLDGTLAGAETKVEAYGGCPSGIDVQLWTIQGGGHIPSFNRPTWGDSVWGFFSAHTR